MSEYKVLFLVDFEDYGETTKTYYVTSETQLEAQKKAVKLLKSDSKSRYKINNCMSIPLKDYKVTFVYEYESYNGYELHGETSEFVGAENKSEALKKAKDLLPQYYSIKNSIVSEIA